MQAIFHVRVRLFLDFVFPILTALGSISDSDGDDEGESTQKKPDTVNFVVMLKKNNKPQVRP